VLAWRWSQIASRRFIAANARALSQRARVPQRLESALVSTCRVACRWHGWRVSTTTRCCTSTGVAVPGLAMLTATASWIYEPRGLEFVLRVRAGACRRSGVQRLRGGTQFLLAEEDGVAVAELLAGRFGLPQWQLTLSATQANGEAIRLARDLRRALPQAVPGPVCADPRRGHLARARSTWRPVRPRRDQSCRPPRPGKRELRRGGVAVLRPVHRA
jgi:hypothetical protein